jgi:hypothetical protein
MERAVDNAIDDLKGETSSLDEAKAQLPKRSGIYAWWMVGTPLSCAPVTKHPKERGLGLVYVGIAPNGAGSKSTLRSRVVGNHLNGNIAASTLRRTLASLLLADLSLVPLKKGTKVILSPEHNALLSKWQQTHLRLTWHETAKPWDIEDKVIAALQPPLNLDDNEAHPFFATLSAARRALKTGAR